MLEFLKFACSGFWIFCGVIIILNGAAYFFVNMVVKIWIRYMRYLSVKSKGWPPSHLDADGDWKPEPKSKDSQHGT
jgi:hypothetical protein